jgi:hypothetical protein
MQIDLPPDVIQRLELRVAASGGITAADVIRKSLDALDTLDIERQAIQEGIDAWRAGDTQELNAFDAEFRAKNGIQTEV